MFGENKNLVGSSFSREVKADRLVGFHSESNSHRDRGNWRFYFSKNDFRVQVGQKSTGDEEKNKKCYSLQFQLYTTIKALCRSLASVN